MDLKDPEAEGPELPFRLEAHATEHWNVDVLPPARLYHSLLRSGRLKPHSTWPSQFYFSVQAGNGKSARNRNAMDARGVIADAESV